MPALTLANLAIYAAQVCVIVGATGAALTVLRPGPRVRLAVLRLVFLAIVMLPLQPPLSPAAADPMLARPAGLAMASDNVGATPRPARRAARAAPPRRSERRRRGGPPSGSTPSRRSG